MTELASCKSSNKRGMVLKHHGAKIHFPVGALVDVKEVDSK